jgi:RNA polymerase sigma factor (sigma-70 family)
MAFTGHDISDQKRTVVAPSLDGGRFDSMSKAERLAVVRARRNELLGTEIGYVGNEAEFRERDSWERIVESPEPSGSSKVGTSFVTVDAGHLQHVFKQPILTRDQEHYLFRKMNYLKFVAHEVKETLSEKKVEPSKVARIDELLARSEQIRARLIEVNLRLLLSVGLKFYPKEVDKCVSIGVTALMDAVDKFDYQRGFKFSTFATRPIGWEFLKYRQTQIRPRGAFDAKALSIEGYDVPDKSEGESIQQLEELGAKQMTLIKRHLETLDLREQEIIVRRFGLNGADPETLTQVGERLGVSKERIRQIEFRTLVKLSSKISVDEACLD